MTSASVPVSDDLRFPVGKFSRPKAPLDSTQRAELINALASMPALLDKAVLGLDEKQIDTPYRDGGWTVRQVVHHLADSHMNAYVRFKLALTESNPTVKPYDETEWAKLVDSMESPVAVSQALVTALHERWVLLMRRMTDADFKRTVVHPDHGPIDCDFLLALYGWHSRHHVAHITALRKRNSW